MNLIGVTGGIGSGKSIVCRICALRGVPVYDCDARARHIMHSDPAVRHALTSLLGPDIYLPDGSLHRPRMAEAIFSSTELRTRVNAIVHRAVHDDILHEARALAGAPMIVESAIMTTSSLHLLMRSIWLVEAPEDLRIARVKARSSLPEEQIRARIRAQQSEYDALPPHLTLRIINDGIHPLLPQIPEISKQ